MAASFKGMRRTHTAANVGGGVNISQVVQTAHARNGGAGERGGQTGGRQAAPKSTYGGGSDGQEFQSRQSPKSRVDSPPRDHSKGRQTNSRQHYAEMGGGVLGVRELLTQQLAAARQDLAHRTQAALEDMQHACLDSLQHLEAANAQLRRENERLKEENERLQGHLGSGGGAAMGGTGESPALRSGYAPARQTRDQEGPAAFSPWHEAPEERSGGQQAAAGGPPHPTAASVVPPVSKRPPTPSHEEGPPPTMAIPGSVAEDKKSAKTKGEHCLSDIDMLSDAWEEEDRGAAKVKAGYLSDLEHPPSREDCGPAARSARRSKWRPGSSDGKRANRASTISSRQGEDEEDDEAGDGKSRRGRRRRSVFADADKMKAKVREAVMKKEYDVKNFYKEKGWPAAVARSIWFEHATLSVIFFNAVWISVELDRNKEKFLLNAHPLFVIVEFTFCTYFFAELIVRFLAFAEKKNCLRDMWFIFDGSLVAMMLTDTVIINMVIWAQGGSGANTGAMNPTILRMFRLLKLTRMARMLRLLRSVPELMILIKGIAVAFRSVIFTLCLLLIFIYLFAILFKSLLEESPVGEELFPDIPHAMLNLLTQGTLPDHEALIMKIWDDNVLYGLLALFFVLMTSLTVMNMLVGVLVEVVGVVSSVERESMNVQFVYSKLQELLTTSGLDADGDMRISKVEFEGLLMNPKAARMVQEVGVDVVGLVDFSEYLFQNDATLSFPEFMDLVLQLRGSNTATVKDVVDLRKFISSQVMEISDVINSLPSGMARAKTPTGSRGAAGRTATDGTSRTPELGAKRSSGPLQVAPAANWHPSQWAAPRPGSNSASPHGLNLVPVPGSFESLWLSTTVPDKHTHPQLLDEEV